MSASNKKKLRKEEKMAQLTQRQQTEQKEAKKLRVNSIVFITVIALVFCIGIGMIAYNWYASSGLQERWTTAVQIGDHKISAAEMNYYYIDTLNQLGQDWYSMYMLQYNDGFKPSVALDQQQYKDEAGKTWGDHFVDQAIGEAAGVLAMCDEAKKAGFTLTDENRAEVEQTIAAIKAQGLEAGFGSLDDYLQAIYGNGAQAKTYRTYLENIALAQNYSSHYIEGLTYSDEDISAKDAETPGYFSNYDYTFYQLNADDFMVHTHDADGKEIHDHTDEEVATALEKAEAAAKELVASGAANKEQLDAAIANLPMYKAEETAEESTEETTAENTAENTTEATTEEGTTEDGEEAEENEEEEEETSSIPTSTQRVDYEYSYIPAEIAEWLAAEGRQKGDIGYVTVYAKNSEGEATDDAECYYVVILDNVDEHPEKLVSVRHILVGFEGGTEDEESGETVYSDEEKKAASDEAERIKAEFEGGEKTAEAFGELAKKYSDDNAEAGGLYEDVYPGRMQAPFDEWCFDSARKAGDVGIVETVFGYHVIYFVETQEQTYREYIITNTLRNEEAEEWFNGLREAYKTSAEISNTSFMNTSIILSK